MKINIVDDSTDLTSTVIIGVATDLNLPKAAMMLDKESNGSINKALELGSFKGKKSENLFVIMPTGSSVMAVMLVGLGKVAELTENDAVNIGGEIYSLLTQNKIKRAQLIADFSNKSVSSAALAARLALGLKLKSYRFLKYMDSETLKDTHKPTHIDILSEDSETANSQAKSHYAVADGVFLAKDFVSEPPNSLHPESYAKTIQEEFGKSKVKVTVLGEKELQKLGANTLLGVGQGSIKESKMVVMEYNGGKSNEAPVAFVGKGVTFDSGGISLKPSAGMEDMKYDMAGSAAVVGTMKALANRGAKVNAVGIVGLVENMPSGNAQRPSDVVKTMSGKTVEILNTDAEGRLVLADALWYCQSKYKPKFMVNLATLTGAIIISLGSKKAGLFSNDDKLSEQLTKSGEKTHEYLWRLPLGQEYDDMLKSDIADIANISPGREAGSITAAQFLQRFVNKVPWAHLDIAGVAWNKKGSAISVKGATGYGVRLLNKLVEDYYE